MKLAIEIFELLVLIGTVFWLRPLVKKLKSDVKELKKDADAFGVMLKTKRALDRVYKQNKERKNEIIRSTLQK